MCLFASINHVFSFSLARIRSLVDAVDAADVVVVVVVARTIGVPITIEPLCYVFRPSCRSFIFFCKDLSCVEELAFNGLCSYPTLVLFYVLFLHLFLMWCAQMLTFNGLCITHRLPLWHFFTTFVVNIGWPGR